MSISVKKLSKKINCTSDIKLSACFRSSPIIRTVDVVPSPVASSIAVEALAIRLAVGC